MFVIDTNVVSKLMRPEPTPAVAAWIAERDARESTLSIPGWLQRSDESYRLGSTHLMKTASMHDNEEHELAGLFDSLSSAP